MAETDDPGEDLGAVLNRLLGIVVEREAPILEAHGVTMWEYVILDRLSRDDGLTQKELARRSGRDPTRLIGHLDALGGRDLIGREVDGSDRRRRTVKLTRRGRELVHDIRRDVRRMEADLLGGLTAGAQDDLRAYLGAVLRRADPSESPSGDDGSS